MFQFRVKRPRKVKHRITGDQGGVIGLLIFGNHRHVVYNGAQQRKKAR